MTIAGVLLAAGEGRRYAGEDHKLRALAKGKPVFTWAIEHLLEAGLDETIVVAGAVDLADLVPGSVTLLHNESWEEGQALSLQVAVTYARHMGHEAIVVGLGDMPAVPASAWTAVAECEAEFAMASYTTPAGKTVLSPPTRLSSAVWPSLPFSGDEGARALLRQHPDLVVPVSCEGQQTDLDTLEDFRRWS